MSTQKFLVTVLALAAVPGAASELAFYTTQTGFETANPTFLNLPLHLGDSGASFTETASDGSQFTFTAGGGVPGLSVTGPFGGSWGTGNVLKEGGSGMGEIDVTFPSAVRGFGFYAGSISSPVSLTIVYASGATYTRTLTISSTNPNYYGALTDAAITALAIRTDYSFEQGAITNFEFANQAQAQAQTPEAATFLLIGFGLIAMRWLSRRRRTLARPTSARYAQYRPAEPVRA